MTLAQTALTQISSLASSLNAQIADLNDITPEQVDIVASTAKSALQQVASLLDTADGGSYVFAGTDSANPPVPQPDQIATSGLYTQIAASVGALATNGAAATASATLAIASSNAAGTTPFSATIGSAPTIEAGGQTVQVGVLANANTLAVSAGGSTTGSYMRDILRSLATLANLSSSQVNEAGFTGLVQDTKTCLGVRSPP